MEKPDHIAGKESNEELGRHLARNGQVLLPMVELIEESKMAVDELIAVLGRAQVEAVLRLSAERVAGPPHPGKKNGAIGWHGRERGTVCLKERKLRVKRPQLRKKGQGEDGEVPIPAYEAMRRDERLGRRMPAAPSKAQSCVEWFSCLYQAASGGQDARRIPDPGAIRRATFFHSNALRSTRAPQGFRRKTAGTPLEATATNRVPG